MNQALLDKIESEQFRKEPAVFAVGDSVRVHTKVVEGDKERIQIFSGVVIGRRGHGLNEMFTVRRISYGEGVERVDVNSEHRRTTIKVMLRTDTFAQTIGLANVQRPAGSCAW